VFDNLDIAVLAKVNELAERHGLKPYDFVAIYRHDTDKQQEVLSFESPAGGNALREQRFGKMLADLGVGDNDKLRGTPATIVDALDHAISVSPRRRY
jgi:hypothetical protein